MRKSKLFRMVRALTLNEIKTLGIFLTSPYSNCRTSTIQLYNYIYTYRNRIDDQNFERFNKRIAFSSLFPGEKYDDAKIRKIMSQLTKQIENFLIIEELKRKENRTYRDKLLVESLSKRKDYQTFEQETETQIGRLQKLHFKSRNDLLNLFWLYEKLYTHPATNTYNAKGAASILERLEENLNEFLVYSKLFWGLEIKTRQKIFKEENLASNFFLEEAIELSKSFKDTANRYGFIRQFFRFAQITDQNAVLLKEFIDRFIQFYQGRAKKIPDSDFILTALLNEVTRYVNADVSNFKFTLLDLYKFGINENLLIQNGLLRGTKFSNISIQASTLKQFEWADSFMKANADKVPEPERKQVLNLSYAFWYFHKGLAENKREYFLTAQEYLGEIPYQFLKNDLRIRSLQLRLFYENEVLEKNNEGILFNNSAAFKAFLYRNQELSEAKKRSYSNFIDAITFLTKLHLEIEKEQQNNLVKKLMSVLHENNKELISRSWLLQKFHEWKNRSGLKVSFTVPTVATALSS